MIETDLQILIEKCKQGDARSYRRIYDMYAKAMYNISYRIIPDSRENEDILQEAFIDVFKGLKTLSSTQSFGAWLKRIVINKSLDALKKKKQLLTVQIEEHLGQEEGFEEPPFPVTFEQVRKAIEHLPPGYRTVLCLYLFEEYTHHQIALLLDMNESTVRSQYRKAKQMLLAMLKNANYE